MRTNRNITREFVDFIPREMEADTLYIAMEFATASHRCFCGCGAEVVTPLSPVGWQLYFDGETVSLTPSVGSWSLPCQSHYWIRRDGVEWAGAMSSTEIAQVRERDRRDVQRHYDGAPPPSVPPVPVADAQPAAKRKTLWDHVARFWR